MPERFKVVYVPCNASALIFTCFLTYYKWINKHESCIVESKVACFMDHGEQTTADNFVRVLWFVAVKTVRFICGSHRVP